MEEDEGNHAEEIDPTIQEAEELDFSNKENESDGSHETRDGRIYSKKYVPMKREISRV